MKTHLLRAYVSCQFASSLNGKLHTHTNEYNQTIGLPHHSLELFQVQFPRSGCPLASTQTETRSEAAVK